jgi:uncharacterized membrane protein YqaE (UPF0057 family)
MSEENKNKELTDVFALILAIIFPPLGVLLKRGLDLQFLINLVLTLFGWLPGIIHALYIVLKSN